MLKANPKLVDDVDEERVTPLHYACHIKSVAMAQVMIDFGGKTNKRDDYQRKPIDMISTYVSSSDKEAHEIIKLIETTINGQYKRDIQKYNEPLYVKYLTPVEQIHEFQNFLTRMLNRPSTIK